MDAPFAFSSSWERESRLGPEWWEERVAESERGDAAVFVAVEEGRSLGMAGGFFVDAQRDVAVLWGTWVDSLARRRGVAEALVEAVAGWARERGAERVRLRVTDCEDAEPAAALYRKLQFADTGEREPLESNPALMTRVLTRAI
jgi:GNAT superfamily N-acetyltransferase